MIQKALKRTFDIVFSVVGLVFFAAFLPFIAFIIKLDSSGPIFFCQERVGKKGKVFKIWKFRTMAKDAEKRNFSVEQLREFEKKGGDPRVTKVGRFLRHFALDECPQLINILAGQMSFVGPRPVFPPRMELNKEWEKRTAIRPGLTSLAVIKGGVSLSDEEILRYDLEYIKKQSFWLDADILLKTIVLYLRKINGKKI